MAEMIGLYALVWYTFSIFQTITDKNFYTVYPLPITITLSHMLINPIGLYIAASLSGAKRIVMCQSQIPPIFCLAAFKVSVSILSHYTVLWLSVPMMETLKTISPIFVLVITRVLYGTVYTTKIYTSMLMMVFGVLMATFTERQLVVEGLLTSTLMVLCSQSQNLFLKQCYGSVQLHPFALLFNVHVFGLMLVFPIWYYMDLPRLIANPEFTLNPDRFIVTFLTQGCFSIVTHVVKALLLSNVTSLTYSVAETGKALFKIFLGYIRYEKPTGIVNVLGTLFAIFGIFLYSKARAEDREKEKKE